MKQKTRINAIRRNKNITQKKSARILDDSTKMGGLPNIGNQLTGKLIRRQGGMPGALRESNNSGARLVGRANDKQEVEADQMADAIMRKNPSNSLSRGNTNKESSDLVQRNHASQTHRVNSTAKPSASLGRAPAQVNKVLNSSGHMLDASVRNFMEPRFGYDFSKVRVHSDPAAMRSARSIDAKAYTSGNHIVFGQGQYQPDTEKGKRLLAHELTHVMQQEGKSNLPIQRTIEFRPPGRGEATAFDRAGEIVARLNRLSLAVSYSIAADGRTLNYRIIFPQRIDNFDQQMMDFIDLQQVIPLRLITSAGTVGGFPIVGDSFLHGYVDVDDLMASDDLGFQSIMLHFIEERAVTNRYAQRIGSPSLNPGTPAGNRSFRRGHRAGHTAQAEHFQDVFGDPSITFNHERANNRGDAFIVFRSATHNYRIIITLRRAVTSATGARPRNVTGGTVTVRYQRQTYTVEDFLDNGPLANVLGRQLNLRMPNNFGRPRLGFGIPPLSLNPSLGGPSLGPSLAPNLQIGAPSPSLPLPTSPRRNFSNFSFPTLTPSPSLIDWLAIRGELHLRGAPFNDQMASSIVSLWNTNYSFLNQVVGLSPERAAFWTNKTIPMAVGAGLNRDYPTMIEQMDRELNTSTINIPVSDILLFLFNR